MAVIWDDAIDLNQNELRNAVIQNLGSDPGSPVNGQFWYLTSGTHDVRVRVNGATVSLLPSSLLASANAWSGTNTFNAAVNGSGTINLTGAGASSVGGSFAATVHGATGLAGATAASRYVGATAAGAPASGAFAVGDFVIAQNGHLWICTVAGTSGTWVDAGAAGAPAASSTVVAQTSYGLSSTAGVATPYARGDHAHGTPTHIGTDHSGIRLSDLTTPTAAVSFGSQRIISLADPIGAQDAVTKSYADSLRAGLSIKDPVRLATAAALPAYTATSTTLTANANGALSIDGTAVAVADRVLVKNGAAGADNGIYSVTQTGSGAAPFILTRASDADTSGEIVQGTAVWTDAGTTNANTRFVATAAGAVPWVPGTTSTTWTLDFAATAATAGAGLTASGTSLNVGAGTGISVAADSVSIDTAVTARWKTALIGTGAATSIAVTHNLGNQFVVAMAYYVSTNAWAPCSITLTDANTTTFGFASAPALNSIRVVIVG